MEILLHKGVWVLKQFDMVIFTQLQLSGVRAEGEHCAFQKEHEWWIVRNGKNVAFRNRFELNLQVTL